MTDKRTDTQTDTQTDRISSCRLDPFCSRVKTDIQFLSRMSLNTCSTFARKGANLGQNLILREAFRFGRPPPPKRLKSELLLSDYRQKFVNGTRNILMLKLEFV